MVDLTRLLKVLDNRVDYFIFLTELWLRVKQAEHDFKQLDLLVLDGESEPFYVCLGVFAFEKAIELIPLTTLAF